MSQNTLSIVQDAVIRGLYGISATFTFGEPLTQQVNFDDLPEASREVIVRIGLTNVLRDSMAGKAGDPVEARQALADKIARLLAGDVSGAARGPRLSPEERHKRAYLDEVLASRGLTFKGAELTKARELLYQRNTKAVDAEVRRRMKDAGEMDLGDLLDGAA